MRLPSGWQRVAPPAGGGEARAGWALDGSRWKEGDGWSELCSFAALSGDRQMVAAGASHFRHAWRGALFAPNQPKPGEWSMRGNARERPGPFKMKSNCVVPATNDNHFFCFVTPVPAPTGLFAKRLTNGKNETPKR